MNSQEILQVELAEPLRSVLEEEVAEVFAELDESHRPKLEKIMAECPGHAILWKKK